MDAVLHLGIEATRGAWQRAMTSTAFDTSASGIQAATVKMQANANNVANANTDGYQAQRVDYGRKAWGGRGADRFDRRAQPR